MELIFKGERSGDEINFPIVGDWKSGKVKEVTDKQAEILLKFSCVKEFKRRKKLKTETSIPEEIPTEITEEIDTFVNQDKEIDTMKRDELIAECIGLGIDPPDKSTKSELRDIINEFNSIEGGE